ncbi:SRPBCC family protein [Herbiconiux sp. KACC 21604]|uniref:SRPBCC family protein n=1 Tax=unclassified Herbiconiux TaxID=2618217 RepID=UPI0014920818|nr:SRPBCC family protein [Herbiconiux sp. SALV-R1]QJU53868.1 SRPBCC family protein [Herbiconiux sp. SALV-R1]WPO84881.1 SRPBCC family protein [Herbiconiux sp. KACC 21604]
MTETLATAAADETSGPGRFDPERDLGFSRVIRAPRDVVWRAWTDPRQLEQWWLPAPSLCRVEALELRPGGAFTTLMSDDGEGFRPHVTGCILDVRDHERIVFTTMLAGGWRPAADGFMTAVIEFVEHPDGTEYRARVLHKDRADRDMHDEAGFADGWGTVAAQLAALVERG